MALVKRGSGIVIGGTNGKSKLRLTILVQQRRLEYEIDLLDDDYYKNGISRPEESELNYLPIASISRQRKTHMETMCNKLGYQYTNEYLDVTRWLKKSVMSRPRLYYSDKHKVIVCGVPKCGSTEWRKAILIVEGEINVTRKSEIDHEFAFVLARQRRFYWQTFRSRTAHAIDMMNKRLNNYYRVMTVREPLERVVSAYIDKMLPGGSGDEFYKGISTAIHREFAQNRHSKDFKPGRATFEEFVDSIINNPKGLDIHWMVYSDICDPCHTKYDYIAKLETITSDSEYVSKMTKIKNSLLFPRKVGGEANTLQHKWKEKYKKYLQKLPDEKLRALFDVYREQYQLFGYKPPAFLPI